jgi:hypothetical protein
MDSKQTYSAPILVDLGDAVAATTGGDDPGDEPILFTLATGDI